MQFNRIRGPVQDLALWGATSTASPSSSALKLAAVLASADARVIWRLGVRSIRRCAVKVGGSPFESLVEAEMACNAMLAHLIRLT
jgi:hypothetical protein